MHSLHKGLFVILLAVAAGGALLAVDRSNLPAVAAEEKGGDHWQNFDGHWSYWHAGDKRW